MKDTAYSFREGLIIDRAVIQTPDSIAREDLLLDNILFDPEPLQTDENPVFETFYSSRRQLTARTITRASDKLAVHVQAWGGTAENPVTAHEAQRFDEVFDEYDTLHLTMPGHGQQHPSSRWPIGVRMQLHTSGSFLRAGGHLATFLRESDQIFNADTIDIVGTSTGGRSAIGLAAELGRTVSNLVLFDAPGSEKLSYTEFKERFTAIEGHYGSKYQAASMDSQYQDIMSSAPRRATMTYLKAFARRDVRAAYDFYISEIYGMAKGALERDLLRAPLENVARIVFISPDESALNDPHLVNEALRNAKLHHPSTAFEHYTVNGTHVMPRGASTTLAWLSRAALRPADFRI